MNPLVQNALGFFLGGLPLFTVIGWAAFQQTNQFTGINTRLARIEKQLDDLGTDLKNLGIRVSAHDTKIAVIETRINAPKIVA